jgi:pimeloyl-ACP methyl ester carboxylesterase
MIIMQYSSSHQGFRLAYDRHGSGAPVVLLHGWPGDRTDYDALWPQLVDYADVIVPDLRGFGESDKHAADAEECYSGTGQANGVIALLDELGATGAVLAGFDVGSFVAQTVARLRPDLARALVVSPPLPGAGKRVLELTPVKEFWYTSLHKLGLAEELIDGKPDAVRAYLRHFWEHWSGPNYVVDESRLDHLTEMYSAPGAFISSVQWYRSSGDPVSAYAGEVPPETSERLRTPTTVLWQEHDAIFPQAWSNRLDEFFADYELQLLPGVGHFTPLEATDDFAEAIRTHLK